MENELHVVLEIDSGKNPYMETLDRLRELGWTESNQYSAYSNVANDAGQDAGEDLTTASDDEIFAALDNELGIS